MQWIPDGQWHVFTLMMYVMNDNTDWTENKEKVDLFYAIDLWGYITSLLRIDSLIRYELVLIITSGVSVSGIVLNESYVEDA